MQRQELRQQCRLEYTNPKGGVKMEIPVKPLQSLEAQRLHAAQASGGTSLDVIYDRILEIIQECDLRGRALDYGAGIGNLTRRLWESRRFEQITGADILPRPQDLPKI